MKSSRMQKSAHRQPSRKMATRATPKAPVKAVAKKVATRKTSTSPATGAFRKSRATFDEAEVSPAKLLHQTQKFFLGDVAELEKELGNTDETNKQHGLNVTVDNDGMINVRYNRLGYDIVATYDMEYEYPDPEDAAPVDEQQEEGAEQEGGEDDPFHNFTLDISRQGLQMKLGCTLSIEGQLMINTMAPIVNGRELRVVSVEDVSDAAFNGFCDTLEGTFITDELSQQFVAIARDQRIRNHIESLCAISDFLGAADLDAV